MLPLVARAARALTMWLAPAYGGELRLEPDLDPDLLAARANTPTRSEALSPEREALWARLDAASFLTDDEKRAAAGYGPKDEEVADDSTGPFAHKYNPNQPRVPAGNRDGGQWTDGSNPPDGSTTPDQWHSDHEYRRRRRVLARECAPPSIDPPLPQPIAATLVRASFSSA